MVAHQKYFFNTARVFLLGAPLILAACTSDFGPYPMPTGYTYHGDVYKAPPGPEPVLKRIEHANDAPQPPVQVDAGMPAQDVYVASPIVVQSAPGEAWDNAARELVTRMTGSFGMPTEAVYLRAADMASPAEVNLEQALRGVMTQSGFQMAAGPGSGPYTLHYAVSPLSGVSDGSRMMVTITLMGRDGAVAEESGIYTLNAMADSSVSVIAPPVPAAQVETPSGAPVLISPAQ